MKKPKYQLKFPSYEELKALPFRENNGEDWVQYEIFLFDTPLDVYGRFTLNEDDCGYIIFDVMEGGFSGMNDWEKRMKFNKKNYQEMCRHANTVYNLFIETLLNQEYRIGDPMSSMT